MKTNKLKIKKMNNGILVAIITLAILSISTILLFHFVNQKHMKTIFNQYDLSLNETVAIYEIEKQTDIYIFITIIFLIVFFMIYLITNYLIRKREKEQFKKIINNIKNIYNRNYHFIFQETDKNDFSLFQNEIYQTIIQLQEYADEVEQDRNKLIQYLSDISHQLRTPLLSITILTDALLENDIEFPEKERQFVYDISNQLDKMRWLVESLLKMAQLDTKTIILKKEKIKINELLKAVVQNLEILLEIRNQKVEINGEKEILLEGDFKWNVEALTNIIKNATEHSEEGSSILINCAENPLYTEICIQDKGEGISEEELPHIFDKFYKGKNANTDSFGIGLSLAKEIILAQNGEIQVESKIGKGTKFIIHFLK